MTALLITLLCCHTTSEIMTFWFFLLCALALLLALFLSSPILPEELQCHHHHCPPQNHHPRLPANTKSHCQLKTRLTTTNWLFTPAVKTLTSVRGSSASRLTAGIWSSRGLFDEDDDEEDEDDVACSRKSRLIRRLCGYYVKTNRIWTNLKQLLKY